MTTTTATTTTVLTMAVYHDTNDDNEMVSFFQRLESRVIPVVCTGYSYLVAADDRNEITDVASEYGVTVEFSPAGEMATGEEMDASSTKTADVIALVERASGGHLHAEAGDDATTWSLSGTTTDGLYWETQDEQATDRREAAIDALNYLIANQSR